MNILIMIFLNYLTIRSLNTTVQEKNKAIIDRTHYIDPV